MGTMKSIEKKATQFKKISNKISLVFNYGYMVIFIQFFKSLESGLREGLDLIPTRQHEVRSPSKQETYIFKCLTILPVAGLRAFPLIFHYIPYYD